MMNRFGLPVAGWTYCPRCNAENMRAVEEGRRYECLICGLGMTVNEIAPNQYQLNADSMLTMEEAIRYQGYLLGHYNQGPHKESGARGIGIETKPPRRVRTYFGLCRAIGKLFGCYPATVQDLKSKGETTWTRHQ